MHSHRFHSVVRRVCTALVLALATISAAQAAPDAKAARLYEDALVRYEKKDLKGAIIQLKNALQIDRSMLPVQVLLGRALLADGQVAAAEIAFLEALDLGVNRAEIVLPMIDAALTQGHHRDVLKETRFAAEGLPRGLQARVLLQHASAAADLGDTRDALRFIELARAIDPAAPDSWLAEVSVQLRMRQFERAQTAVAKAQSLAPGSATAFHHQAQVHHLRGDLNAALAAYSRTLDVAPDHVEALIARAGLLIDLGRGDEAQADLTRMAKIVANDPRAAYLTALLAERAGRQDQARAALKRVTSLIDPVPITYIRYKPQVLMLNGLAHFGLGEREAAKPYLEAFQRLDPGGGASKLLAQILLGEGKTELAIEALEAYLRAHPTDSQAQALLTSAHMAQGRIARATSVARDGLRQRDAPELRTALGLSLMQAGQGVDALTELEAAYRKDPGQSQAGAALVSLYLQSGQAKKALGIAQTLVKQRPGQATFHLLLGQARLRTGDRPGARGAYMQAAQIDAGLVGAHILLARLDALEGKLDSGILRLTEILARRDGDIDLHLELASMSLRDGRPDEAQRWLEKAAAHAGPRETRPALALVELHLRQGHKDKALAAAKDASAKTPGDLMPYLALARAQIQAGDADGSRVSLSTATRLADYEPAQQLEIALLQMLAGNLPGAAYSLDKALSTRPDYLPALAAMVDVEIRQGELAKADQRARAIAGRVPQQAIGHSLIGDVAWARGDLSAAASAFRRAHQVQPSTDTMLNLHSAIKRLEGAKSALGFVEQWLRTHPEDRAALAAAAGLQAGTGQLPAARRGYEALLVDTPDDPELLNNLANVLLLQKAYPQAAAAAERALAAAPNHAGVIDTLGWALFHQGQTDRALQLLRDARLRLPTDPTVRYHLAAVLTKAGRREEARTELADLLARTPRFEGSEQARSLLQSLQ